MLKSRITVDNGSFQRRAQPQSGGARALRAARSGVDLQQEFSKGKVEKAFGAGIPTSVTSFGGVQYNTMFRGILPDSSSDDAILGTLIRDIYAYDNVGGSAVDLMSGLPFSNWNLIGVDNRMAEIYSDSMARLNMRTMLPEVSTAYLVDGAFIGTLLWDPSYKAFQDVLIHDRLNATLSPRPFFSIDPVITVNSAHNLEQFFSSYSPYAESTIKAYPRRVIENFMQGSNVLDPVTTLFMMRRGTQDKTSVSYLRRLLPMYMLEKSLFRGTITESAKRQRATTHIAVGDDAWEPTPGEMQTILEQFQMSDMDPLGAWIVTRNGVTVNDGLRQGGDFWKWTDAADTLVPYKLRALGISESFMSADANFSNTEAALTMFLDNMETYRQYLTYKIFDSKLFPLIAVLNGLYRDKSKVKAGSELSSLLYNLNNQKNLFVPKIQWHKNLTSPNSTQLIDNLEKLTEKGFPVPLKTWAAAANIDLGSMLADLEQDNDIRMQIDKLQGVKEDLNDAIGKNTDPDDFNQEDFGDESFAEASTQNPRKALKGLQELVKNAEVRSAQSPVFARRKNLLSREFSGDFKLSKTGKMVPASANESRMANEKIIKAAKGLQNPHELARVKQQVIAKLGKVPRIGW